LEHVARASLAKRLLGTYISCETKDELIAEAHPAINSAVDEARGEIFGDEEPIQKTTAYFCNEVKERLHKEEDIRIIKAGYLIKKGFPGIDVVKTLLPSRVEYPVESNRIRGRVDAIFEPSDRIIPVEYKITGYSPGIDISAWEIQLAAYAILLEEKMDCRVEYGILHLTRTFTEIPVIIGDELRAKVARAIIELEACLDSQGTPGTHAGCKCEFCEFSEVCTASGREVQIHHENGPRVEETSNCPNIYDRIMSQKGERIAIFDEEGDGNG
jgi:CRISPR-associated protein Cas4